MLDTLNENTQRFATLSPEAIETHIKACQTRLLARVKPTIYARNEIEREFRQLVSPFSKQKQRKAGLWRDQNAWMTDSGINAFFNGLKQNYPSLSLATISSFEEERENETLPHLFAQNKRKVLKHRLNISKVFFWPINHKNHWYLLAFIRHLDEFEVLALDGFNNHDHHTLLKDKALPLLRALYPQLKETNFHFKSMDVPEQNNLYDCGPAICFFADLICKSLSQKFEPLRNSLFNAHHTQPLDYTFARFFTILPMFETLHGFECVNKKNIAHPTSKKTIPLSGSSFEWHTLPSMGLGGLAGIMIFCVLSAYQVPFLVNILIALAGSALTAHHIHFSSSSGNKTHNPPQAQDKVLPKAGRAKKNATSDIVDLTKPAKPILIKRPTSLIGAASTIQESKAPSNEQRLSPSTL